MKRIVQDIKNGTFGNIYLLYGEEAYLRRQYRDNLKKALVPEDDTMNCSVYSGKDINVNEVIDLAGTMPFFAERRVIIVENSGFFKSAVNERLLELIKQMPETTYFLFVEEEVDKRGKLYKAVTANGYAALCEVQDEATLKKWIMSLLKKENKMITADALNLLLDKTGANMETIRREALRRRMLRRFARCRFKTEYSRWWRQWRQRTKRRRWRSTMICLPSRRRQ